MKFLLDTTPPWLYSTLPKLTTEVKRDLEERLVAIERELIELRMQAHYWRALHGRACERERVLMERVRELEGRLRECQKELKESQGVVAALKARLKQLLCMVFGRKSEKGSRRKQPPEASGADGEEDDGEALATKRRGKKRGAKGYGRRRREELPTETDYHPLPDSIDQAWATAALQEIKQALFSEFFFRGDAREQANNLDGAVALLLTAIARRVIGIAPAFLINAVLQSTGKTTLARMVHLIATGRTLPV